MKRPSTIALVAMYLMLLTHMVTHTLFALGIVSVPTPMAVAVVFLLLLFVHVVQSLAKFFRAVGALKKGPQAPAGGPAGGPAGEQVAVQRHYNAYPQLNKTCVIRRLSGLLMLVLVIIHIAPFVGRLIGVIPATLPAFSMFWYRCFFCLMVVLLAVHLVVSVRQLFVRMGIALPKVAVRIIQVIIIALFAWSIVSILVVCGGF